MRILIVALVAAALAGCSARSPLMTAPVVDMAGVDQARYNNDLSACQALKIERNKDTLWTDRIITDCMESRGYKVLQGAG